MMRVVCTSCWFRAGGLVVGNIDGETDGSDDLDRDKVVFYYTKETTDFTVNIKCLTTVLNAMFWKQFT